MAASADAKKTSKKSRENMSNEERLVAILSDETEGLSIVDKLQEVASGIDALADCPGNMKASDIQHLRDYAAYIREESASYQQKFGNSADQPPLTSRQLARLEVEKRRLQKAVKELQRELQKEAACSRSGRGASRGQSSKAGSKTQSDRAGSKAQSDKAGSKAQPEKSDAKPQPEKADSKDEAEEAGAKDEAEEAGAKAEAEGADSKTEADKADSDPQPEKADSKASSSGRGGQKSKVKFSCGKGKKRHGKH